MNVDELLKLFGLYPPGRELPNFRLLLNEEIQKEAGEQGRGDTELMKLLCVYLFESRLVDDSILIWRAKTASMDADGAVEIQLLCGAGLKETKSFLASRNDPVAIAALDRIELCERSGDFEGFSFEKQLESYVQYYTQDED